MENSVISRRESGEGCRSGGNAHETAQAKQVAAAGMSDARAASLTQRQHQQRANNSSQAAQLWARANMMAARSADASVQRVEDEVLLQGKFATVQRELKPMEDEYWSRDADDALQYVTPGEGAEQSLIDRAQARPREEWPLLAYNEKYRNYAGDIAADPVVIEGGDGPVMAGQNAGQQDAENSDDDEGPARLFDEEDGDGIEMVEQQWDEINPEAQGDGESIYVVASTGSIYIADRAPNNHSEPVAGASVYGAGEITFKDGKVDAVDSQSGHYKPNAAMLEDTKTRMTAIGLEFSVEESESVGP